MNIQKFALMFISILASRAVARHGCRRCTGIYSFYLDDFLTESQARIHLKESLGTCATGSEFWTQSLDSNTCDETSRDYRCKYWSFKIMVFRYCGNGGSVLRALQKVCGDEIGCFFRDYLSLICTQSVKCAGNCDCVKCACHQ